MRRSTAVLKPRIDSPAAFADLVNMADVFSQSLLRVYLSQQSIRSSDALISNLALVWIGMDTTLTKERQDIAV